MALVQLIVNAVLTLLLPILAGVVVWLSRILAQSLPDHQGPRLEQFARMAVRSVEQRNPEGMSKQEQADAALLLLLREFHLPVPSTDVRRIVLEAATYDLKDRS